MLTQASINRLQSDARASAYAAWHDSTRATREAECLIYRLRIEEAEARNAYFAVAGEEARPIAHKLVSVYVPA